MTTDKPTLDYACVTKEAGARVSPAVLGVLGIGFYISVFMVLSIPGSGDVRSDGWMHFWLAVLLIGPPYALLILAWSFHDARRARRWMGIVWTVVPTVLMMALWFMLLSGYVYVRRDIAHVRARLQKVQMQQQTGAKP